METHTIFRIILPALIVAFVAHRGYHTYKHGTEENTLKRRAEGLVSKIALLFGFVAFIATIIFVINPDRLAWAALSIPTWLRWAGVGCTILGFTILEWAHHALGRNWSSTPRMIKGQVMITNGPYQFIRHPMYTAFILILGSTFFISANWLIGLAWTGMIFIEIVSRIGFEENLMLEYFGDEYRKYMQRTGRLLPRLIQ